MKFEVNLIMLIEHITEKEQDKILFFSQMSEFAACLCRT